MFSRLFRTLKMLVAIFVTTLFVLFAVVNREFISISLFPLPFELELPKFLVAIICFSAGLLVGGIVMSLQLGKAKRLYKQEHKQVVALQNELKGTQAEQQIIPALGGK